MFPAAIEPSEGCGARQAQTVYPLNDSKLISSVRSSNVRIAPALDLATRLLLREVHWKISKTVVYHEASLSL